MLLMRSALQKGLAFMLIFFLVGLLVSWLRPMYLPRYFNRYSGALSWMEYRVVFRPQQSGHQAISSTGAPVLRYGFNLRHYAALRAEVLQTEVPLAEIAPLIYDTVGGTRFSPDSIYYATVGVRGSYLTFPFGARPAAEILSYTVAAAPATVPAYPPRRHWRGPLLLYSLACLTAVLWLGAFVVALIELPESRGISERLATLVLLLLFAGTLGYIDWLDYPHDQEWPVMEPVACCLLLAAYVYQLRQPLPEPEPEPEAG